MLTSSALVLMMSIPGLALFYGGLVRTKNMLSVLTQVFAIVSMVGVLWVLYGYSEAFTNGGSLNNYVGGFSKAFLKGVDANATAATFSNGVVIPEYGLYGLPDDLRHDHPGADRRRLRRAHQVLGGDAVRAALGHGDLFPDRPHGLVLVRPGRHRRCGQGSCGGYGRRGQGGGAGQARRGQCRRRLAVPVGRARLRGRHRRAHQRWYRGPRRRV